MAFLQVRAAAAEVGGVRALNCKSGKDRTALELAQALSAEACAGGHVPARLQVRGQLRLHGFPCPAS